MPRWRRWGATAVPPCWRCHCCGQRLPGHLCDGCGRSTLPTASPRPLPGTALDWRGATTRDAGWQPGAAISTGGGRRHCAGGEPVLGVKGAPGHGRNGPWTGGGAARFVSDIPVVGRLPPPYARSECGGASAAFGVGGSGKRAGLVGRLVAGADGAVRWGSSRPLAFERAGQEGGLPRRGGGGSRCTPAGRCPHVAAPASWPCPSRRAGGLPARVPWGTRGSGCQIPPAALALSTPACVATLHAPRRHHGD